jgi:RNA polymerase-binding transcription factor DksA
MADNANKISKVKCESEKIQKEDLKKRLQLLKQRIQNTQNMLADCNVSTGLSASLKDQQTGFSMLRDFRKEESEIEDQLRKIPNTTFKPCEKSEILDFAQKTPQKFTKICKHLTLKKSVNFYKHSFRRLQ